ALLKIPAGELETGRARVAGARRHTVGLQRRVAVEHQPGHALMERLNAELKVREQLRRRELLRGPQLRQNRGRRVAGCDGVHEQKLDLGPAAEVNGPQTL